MQEGNEFLIEEIIGIEWEMFSSVNNIGGRAACQDRPDTFDIMRRSNAMTWPDDMLYSYRADLYDALSAGRNLMTEKYARMTEHTAPQEYEAIKGYLPPLAPGVEELVAHAASILMPWEEEVRERYPFIASRGRGLDEGEPRDGKTSFETYLCAELSTYLSETLRCYVAHLDALAARGANGSLRVYENMVRLYGYDTLEQANEAMAPR